MLVTKILDLIYFHRLNYTEGKEFVLPNVVPSATSPLPKRKIDRHLCGLSVATVGGFRIVLSRYMSPHRSFALPP